MGYKRKQRKYNKSRKSFKAGREWFPWAGEGLYGGLSGGNPVAAGLGGMLGNFAGGAFDEWRFRRKAYKKRWRYGYRKGRLGSRPIRKIGSRPSGYVAGVPYNPYGGRYGSNPTTVGSRPY